MRRHPSLAALLVAALGALGLAGCGAEPPAVLDVAQHTEPQTLLVDTRAGVGAPWGEVRVTRIVTLARTDEGLLLRPRDVYVHGTRTAEDGDGNEQIVTRSHGLERSAQAACDPDLIPFWGSSRVTDPDRVELGLLLPDGTLHAPTKAPADHDASIEDAVPFLLRRVPDEIVGLVAAHVAGTWAPNQERVHTVEVRRGTVAPPLEGRLQLRRVPGRAWKMHLDVTWHAEGSVSFWLAWRVVHEVTGFVGVWEDGRLAGGSLSSWTRVFDGDEVLATARHRFTLGANPKEALGDEAAALGHLLALRRDDPHAFDEAVLEQSSASAKALVQRVRPEADLEHVSVFLSDRVEPARWPSGVKAYPAGIEQATQHWERWAHDIERFVPPAPVPPPSPATVPAAAEDGAPEATAIDEAAWDEDWWKTGGAAWTTLGALTAGRTRKADLRLLAHEYAHFASDRFGYADLERVGIRLDDDGTAWRDLDALLAAGLLEEAQAEATALCAVMALYEPTHQREIVRWYGGLDTSPAETLDFRERLHHLAYGASPAVLSWHCGPDDALEDAIANTWAAWPYRTHAVLFPDDEAEPSRLWPRARALRSRGALDATRVGGFTLHLHLDRREPDRHGENLALVRKLDDDVLLRTGEGGLLWLTTWRDEEAAARFFERIEDAPGCRIRLRGRHVVAATGDVPREHAWRRYLLDGVALDDAPAVPERHVLEPPRR